MSGVRGQRLSRRCLGLGCFAVMGMFVMGCKCSPTRPVASTLRRSEALAAVAAMPTVPLAEIDQKLVVLNRSRRFADAKRLLESLPPQVAELPIYRFVNAYVQVRSDDGAGVLPLLDGLESKLTELVPDIEQLRAEAQLQTADALVGASWLEDHGRGGPETWYDAARNLQRLGRRDAAMTVVDKAMSGPGLRPGARNQRHQADLRGLRAELHEANGNWARCLEDWRWLAVEVPTHAASRERVARVLDEGQLQLSHEQRLKRLRRMADGGWLERLDSELTSLVKQQPRLISSGLAAYLRGRVRQVARKDQITGAQLLLEAAEQKAEEPSQLRMDVARLYTREGDAAHAMRIYDQVAQSDRGRSEEARFYAARVAALLGAPERGLERYRRWLERYPKGRLRRLVELELALLEVSMPGQNQAAAHLERLVADAESQDQRALLTELSGLLAEQSGQRELAIERYETAAKHSPFSLAGLFAEARLRSLGSSGTPAVAPQPTSAAPALPRLSRRTEQLLVLGLLDLAAQSMRNEPLPTPRPVGMEATRFHCQAWTRIAYGNRGYIASRALREGIDLAAGVADETRWQWECRFPRPYAAIVEEIAAEFRLPEELMFSIMRQESGFDPEIVSPVGAVGLLQLMPDTARRIAGEIGFAGPIALEDPRTNLRLGAAYLRKLMDLFQQDLVLSVAGYNAGPQAVALWLRHARSSSPELFAARIPYAETQKYVERVFTNLLVYRTLRGFDRVLPSLVLTLPRELPKELKDSGALF